jgi:hypothetical protein
MFKGKLNLLASAGVGLAIGLAATLWAITPSGIGTTGVVMPQLLVINPTDLFQDIPYGVPGPSNYFVTAGQIAGVPSYIEGGAVLTGAAYIFTNTEAYYFVTPAGTLATLALTTAPSPSDGQRECFASTQIISALTWTANTGQIMNPTMPVATLVNTAYCITYVASTATWYHN